MNNYFRIRPRGKPEVNGNVIMQGEKNLEVFAGEAKLSDFNLRIKYGRLEVSRRHSIEQISEAEALRLKEEAKYWDIQAGYVADNS